ncbi:hypothetical protein CB1_001954009 [Camelus ferus]|nr:hypothetical protein CB1_001954009 [Camelus ferus]
MASSQGKNELKFADWMETLPESIHSIPLTNLAIPGRRAEAADGALGARFTCPALLYLPLSGNLPRCPRIRVNLRRLGTRKVCKSYILEGREKREEFAMVQVEFSNQKLSTVPYAFIMLY